MNLLMSLLISAQASAFTSFSKSSLHQCSIGKLESAESFKICLEGNASAPDMARAKEWAALSSLAWLRVFKAFDNTMSATTIEFTCSSPMLTIILKNGSGRSYATAGKTWIYNEVPYGTWTHELGHALVGLGDTYQNASAGNCKRGQPESLMCWGGYGPRRDRTKFSTLWEDDVEGAIHNYRTLYGATLPSAAQDDFNLFTAFAKTNPFPNPQTVQFSFSESRVNIDPNGTLTPINPNAEFE